jgi:hypothetical protein
MGENRDLYRVLVRRPEGKRPLGTTSRRWEIILRRSFRMCVGSMDFIDLAQDRDR